MFRRVVVAPLGEICGHLHAILSRLKSIWTSSSLVGEGLCCDQVRVWVVRNVEDTVFRTAFGSNQLA